MDRIPKKRSHDMKHLAIAILAATILVGCGKKEEDPRCIDWRIENAYLLADYAALKAKKNEARDKVLANHGDALWAAQAEETEISIKQLALGDKIIELQDRMRKGNCEGFDR